MSQADKNAFTKVPEGRAGDGPLARQQPVLRGEGAKLRRQESALHRHLQGRHGAGAAGAGHQGESHFLSQQTPLSSLTSGRVGQNYRCHLNNIPLKVFLRKSVSNVSMTPGIVQNLDMAIKAGDGN